eukprot:SAG11_NODE_9686_length_890_cov_0.749684_3_plen_50_part_01
MAENFGSDDESEDDEATENEEIVDEEEAEESDEIDAECALCQQAGPGPML